VKEETRRSLLTKLGGGAAALVVAGVAGKAEAAKRRVARPARRLNINARRALSLNVGNAKSLQIKVAGTKAGFVVSAAANARPKIGLTNGGKILNLAVKVGHGKVDVAGLDSLLGGGAVSIRCVNSLTDPGSIVSNPAPERLNPASMMKF